MGLTGQSDRLICKPVLMADPASETMWTASREQLPGCPVTSTYTHISVQVSWCTYQHTDTNIKLIENLKKIKSLVSSNVDGIF